MSKPATYKVAVALDYDGTAVPQITASAENLNADLIVKLARRFNVPVVENPKLADALRTLDNNQEIPEHLYEAVALVLHELGRRQ